MKKDEVRYEALKNIMKQAKKEGMEGPIKNGMAVKVAADSKKGLEEGLEKAKEIVADPKSAIESMIKKPGKLGEQEMPDESEMEQAEDMLGDHEEDNGLDNLSREELIAMLKANRAARE